MERLLVVGGSGFIGRWICRQAVRDGYDVRSISRGGRPDASELQGMPGRTEWVKAVEWTSADLFSPHAWRDRLRGVDAVIHAVGIASEAPTEGVTFERLNGDAAILTALEAERAGTDTFVFLSAAANFPTARQEYIRSKRRAERAIAELNFDVVVLRPGPVYGPNQPHMPGIVNRLCAIVDSLPEIPERLGNARPLAVDHVARVALDAAADPSQRLLTIEEIAAHQ